MYLRSVAVGRNPAWPSPGVSGLTQASAEFAAFPRVVKVDEFVRMSWSQGARAARFRSARWQPGTGVPLITASQHQSLRESVLERFSGGFASKAFHSGGYGNAEKPMSLMVIEPAYVYGPGPGSLANGQTRT